MAEEQGRDRERPGVKGGEESVRTGMPGASRGRVSTAALRESLKGIDYPAKKQDMARTAE